MSPSPGADAASTPEAALGAFVGALADGLAAGGVRHVCLCPGSRSTPIAVAVRRHPALRTWVHLDERSCGYFALGLAKATGEPVALLCTSGTAVLNFAPAVAEASLSGVPLVLLTADRPPELRGVGANQTIDQRRAFGSHVKAFQELPVPVPGETADRVARHWGWRAPALAQAAPGGSVHLNLPFRDPLIPDLPTFEVTEPQHSGATPRIEPAPADVADLVELTGDNPRGVIVAGPDHSPDLPQAITGLAAAARYPILADPLSQLRRGPHDRSHVIDSYDTFLRMSQPALQPEVVLRVGGTPTSKALGQFLDRQSGARQVVIAPSGRWNDPDLRSSRSVEADPTAVCRAMLKAMTEEDRGDPAWLAEWSRIDLAARTALDAAYHDEILSEPGAIGGLIEALPPGSTLVAGNSLPIRDVDSMLRSDERPLHVFANRGASGIDGVVSTALGVGAARPEAALALVIGDLSLYHDMNGLLAATRFGIDATIVVLNNDGGGIFSLLPQADRVREFEELFGTPHGLDFEHAAAQYGLDYAQPSSVVDYREALSASIGVPGTQLIELKTDRAANAALHRAAQSRVAEALA